MGRNPCMLNCTPAITGDNARVSAKVVMMFLLGALAACQQSSKNGAISPSMESNPSEINGRQLYEELGIADPLCGGVPTNFPFYPIESARKNVSAHRNNLFAESSTDMGYGIVWGLMDNDQRVKNEYQATVEKYGAINFQLSDTCQQKEEFYSIILGAYNKEVLRLLNAEK